MNYKKVFFYLLRPLLTIRKLNQAFYEYRHPGEPWISQGAVRELERILNSNMVVFEWGSGRSTIWFSQRVKKIVSIEFSEDWFSKVSNSIKEKNITNIDLKYIALDHDKSLPTPKNYDPLPKYVSEIFMQDKDSLDLVVVDGHYRMTCVDQCLDYIRPGGYLLIDNSNWIPLEEWGVPQNWPLIHNSKNIMTQTSIWQKPK